MPEGYREGADSVLSDENVERVSVRPQQKEAYLHDTTPTTQTRTEHTAADTTEPEVAPWTPREALAQAAVLVGTVIKSRLQKALSNLAGSRQEATRIAAFKSAVAEIDGSQIKHIVDKGYILLGGTRISTFAGMWAAHAKLRAAGEDVVAAEHSMTGDKKMLKAALGAVMDDTYATIAKDVSTTFGGTASPAPAAPAPASRPASSSSDAAPEAPAPSSTVKATEKKQGRDAGPSRTEWIVGGGIGLALLYVAFLALRAKLQDSGVLEFGALGIPLDGMSLDGTTPNKGGAPSAQDMEWLRNAFGAVDTKAAVGPSPDDIARGHMGITGPDTTQAETPAPAPEKPTDTPDDLPEAPTSIQIPDSIRADAATVGNPTVEDVMREHRQGNMREAGISEEKIAAWERLYQYFHDNQEALGIGEDRPSVRIAAFFDSLKK